MRNRIPGNGHPGAPADRLGWLGIGALAFAVLALARVLTPDARGFGTHTQLGLPPCVFREWTSLPCPTCGLTTAFAHLSRGHLAPALQAHPVSLPLFALTCAAALVSMWALVRALPLHDTLRRLRATRGAIVLVAALLLHWLGALAPALLP